MSTYFGWSLTLNFGAAEQCWVCQSYKTELDIFFYQMQNNAILI